LKPYMPVVVQILENAGCMEILDAPSGSGWLGDVLSGCKIDGVDLFENSHSGYRDFFKLDLDCGFDQIDRSYEAIVCCEGLEHLGNPRIFLDSAFRCLETGGILVITTPNIWHGSSKLKFLSRGFFPGFPSIVEPELGSHMHIMPWSFPWLYLFLRLSAFSDITLHPVDPHPKNLIDWVFSLPQKFYCRRKAASASSPQEKLFWEMSGSDQSVYGRRLVVSATTRKI